MRYLKYFVILLSCFLISIFIFRLAFFARFDNQITDTTYWEYNLIDNQINNLDEINVTSQGFLNLFRNFTLYFNDVVDTMTSFNVFEAAAQSTKDIWILGAFLNFMSSVYTFIVYIVSLLLSLLQIVIDIVKYVFTIETVTVDTTYVSISDIG